MEISVLTLNCWGIRIVSKDRVLRMEAIAEKLASEKYDFVFLQELWTTEDYQRIRAKTKSNLPYGHYFYSGVIGAGICILSKYKIKSAFFHQWAVNGYMHKIQHGDWFGGKGIGMVEVCCNGLQINLYTTHLHAEYDRQNDEYLAHRVIQAFDTAQFIRMTSQKADFVIVGGDLNTEPEDLAYKVMMHSADLQDTVLDLEKRGPTEYYNTCETQRISYTTKETLKLNQDGKRIDYICFKRGETIKAKTTSCELPWSDRVPGEPFSYSDHEAVVAQFLITKSQSDTSLSSLLHSEEETKDILRECVEICSNALEQLDFAKKAYGLVSISCFFILLISGSFEIPGLLSFILPVARIITLLILVFGIIMGTLWNRMEVNGILAGKLAMELELGKSSDCNGAVESNNHSGDHWTDVKSDDCDP